MIYYVALASGKCSHMFSYVIIYLKSIYRSSIGTIVTPIRGRDPTPSARTQKQPSTSISPIRDLSERQHNLQISPRRETQAHRHDNIPNDTIVGQHKPGSKNPSPRALEESNVPDFVANMIARQDAPQVLSLPSTIFAPPPFQSFESKWKKGKLIGRGTFGKVFAGFNRYTFIYNFKFYESFLGVFPSSADYMIIEPRIIR